LIDHQKQQQKLYRLRPLVFLLQPFFLPLEVAAAPATAVTEDTAAATPSA
jgi:hypothetical protein